jgi:hypothetical protein
MSVEIHFSQVRVPLAGYRWVEGVLPEFEAMPDGTEQVVGEEPEYFLTIDTTGRRVGQRGDREYSPISDEPALFQTFAHLAPDLESILAFANKFGWLGYSVPTQYATAEFDRVPCGDTSHHWINEIAKMQRLTDLWTDIQNNDRQRLNQAIRWENESAFFDNRPRPLRRSSQLSLWPPEQYVQHQIIPSETDVINKHNAAHTARIYLKQQINRAIDTRVSPRLVWQGSRLVLSFQTMGLRAALWLQFALAVQGDFPFDKCAECSTYFQVGRKTGRTDKKYCSDACRSAAYRKRKEGKL